MNARTAGEALAKPTIQMLAIGEISPSRTHIQELRRRRFDPKLLAELAESIKAVGILQPIVARPLALKFEIVAGERRYLAAKIAGLKEVPATVRELSDEQVLEVQLIENLQREGLHELEEAEGYEELMKLKKISADAVADMVGRSRSYVFKRTKLLALCPEARKAFYAGELDASRALLIARIGHHDTQRQALKEIVQADRHDGPMSYREAHHHILNRFMLKLSTAPFDIKDATLLLKAGDCIKCPKRTGNQQELFGDVKSGDVCTDPKCFDDKRQAHFAGARRKQEVAGRKVIYGAEAKKLLPHWEHSDNTYIRGDYLRLDANEWIGGRNIKVSSVLGKDYVPTLIQHPLSGQFIEVAPKSTVSAKAAAASRERTKTRASSGSKTSPAAQKATLEEKVKREIELRIFRALEGKITSLSKDDLIQLAINPYSWDAATDELCEVLGWKKNPTGKSIEKNARALKTEQILKLGFLLCLSFENNSNYNEDPLLDAAKRYKVDVAAIEKTVREELTPKPKTPAKAAPAKTKRK